MLEVCVTCFGVSDWEERAKKNNEERKEDSYNCMIACACVRCAYLMNVSKKTKANDAGREPEPSERKENKMTIKHNQVYFAAIYIYWLHFEV